MSRVETGHEATPFDIDEIVVAVRDLRTSFDTPAGLVQAVNGVSLTLRRGRTLGLVGESGSGKTVLGRSIMGLLPGSNVVRSGSVMLNGIEMTSLTPSQVRNLWGTEVAMVFQDPMTSLDPVMRIGTQVGEGLRDRLGMSRSDARKSVLALLRSVGIPDPERRLKAYPHELSGGLRQRVMIASALSCGPKLLIADEPTTALDVTVQQQILDLLEQQQRDRHMSMILVTHDLGVVAARTDEIAVMYAGRIVEYAPTASLFESVKMPYTESLLKSIPRIDQPSHSRLHAIGGRPPNLLIPPPGCAFSPRCPYVQDRCRHEAPPLEEVSPGHLAACWYPLEAPRRRRHVAV